MFCTDLLTKRTMISVINFEWGSEGWILQDRNTRSKLFYKLKKKSKVSFFTRSKDLKGPWGAREVKLG